ncbi:polyphosphoinositide phosphatase FIG4 [Brevipalpus obovatus]|uniref:polyphosphoinositide phosphatase FIG4 n=1 Tax=Brevipalpus obovatus TaxID=246614 RepID=UPI003D9E6F0B
MSSIISGVQRIVIVETPARYFIVGSNNAETCFRVLKIDRTEPRNLVLVDDRVKYNKKEVTDLLTRINGGRKRATRISAYGIIGFIQFLEGYYMILITKRRKIAQIGHHSIYKIVDTQIVNIPSVRENSNPDEAKYLRMFQNIDLSSNFYFSYSYDLTHTLQYNLSSLNSNHVIQRNPNQTIWESELLLEQGAALDREAVRTLPHWKFVWNEYLLSPVDLHPDWILFITHGFISQTDINVFGKPLHLVLIARRSNRFAGTRFLKRGACLDGSVGNEVETEQIVIDAGVSSFDFSRITSFVQMRGSIPLHWSQFTFKVMPKPPIQLDPADPYFRPAGFHFNDLLSRYGSPIILLNLVKKRERKPHESILTQKVKEAISYLNQFLPKEHHILYVGFDMARMSQLKDVNVMENLTDIGYRMLKLTGLFVNNVSHLHNKFQGLSRLGGVRSSFNQMLQTGLVRVNCVDCLDRTNTAQFALGKCALAYQLYILGVIDKPSLEFDTDAARMLEEIYEDHGDTLALQYGGSQLVHRIRSYRKIAPLSSHSRDIMQTLSRYYSNAFSDADKQNAMNVFLGIYRPSMNQFPIWKLETDFHLHNEKARERLRQERDSSRHMTCWWDEKTAVCLPRPYLELFKGLEKNIYFIPMFQDPDMMTDGFSEQYRPQDLTILNNHLLFEISHMDRSFSPNTLNEQSPFCVRQRARKRKESLLSSKSLPPNPSVSGHVSGSSDNDSDTNSNISEDVLSLYSGHDSSADSSDDGNFSISEHRDAIDLEISTRPDDLELYTKYLSMEPELKKSDFSSVSITESDTTSDHCSSPLADSITVYRNYVDNDGIFLNPSSENIKIYADYLKTKIPT